MEHFNLRNITTWIYRTMIINALFVLCSLPVISIGAASTAAVDTVHHLRTSESDDVFRYFIQSFKSHFKAATKVWIGLLIVGGLTLYNVLNFQPTGNVSSLLWIVQWPLLFQIFIVSIFVFAILSRFEISGMRALKLAWIMGNRNLLLSIGFIGATVIGVEVGRYVPAINIFILMGALHILLDFVLDVSYKRIQLDLNMEA